MKIKTITCQHAYNYGATLQAYALQKYLEILGHDVEIIQFVPWYFHRYDFWYVNRCSHYYKIIQKIPILKLPYCIINNSKQFMFYERKKAFDKFESKYLRLTEKRYDSSDALKKDPPVADMYITGSDQIWNPNSNNGLEEAYYLKFGGNNIYRASYAASFGVSYIEKSKRQQLKNLLEGIDRISVREKTGLEILDSLGISSSVQVMDPVFLLPKREWLSLSRMPLKPLKIGKYILLYDFIMDGRIKKFVVELAKEKGLPIVSVNDFQRKPYAECNIDNAGPLEFLGLIANAEFIVSNSFHVTAFSIIFNKDFYTFPITAHNNSSRMTDLLRVLGVLERFDAAKEVGSEIDYHRVNSIVEACVAQSRKYIFELLCKR